MWPKSYWIFRSKFTGKNQSPTCSKSDSFWKGSTCEPTIDAHVFKVKTFRINGSFSPCLITMLAIWMTGSLSGSGKTPETWIYMQNAQRDCIKELDSILIQVRKQHIFLCGLRSADLVFVDSHRARKHACDANTEQALLSLNINTKVLVRQRLAHVLHYRKLAIPSCILDCHPWGSK